MYIITFYSFKGGVGRTMALVNVAAQLVKRGRKVLVVDFDLEAPGLETYKHLNPDEPHRGIVEYVTKFADSRQVPDIRDYVFKAKSIGEKGGELWVMPAGRRDRTYRQMLVKLNWKRLYNDQEGFLFFEETKNAWEEEYKPDYVLIDSRTGDTDVLGICTRQLPDSVVLLFVPNKQNLAGLDHVCRDIRQEKTEGLKKDIRLHFVAANVPDLDDERGILRKQLRTFQAKLAFTDFSVIRRYESLELLDQSVFVLDRKHSRLARSYQKLTQKLIQDNPADREGTLLVLKQDASGATQLQDTLVDPNSKDHRLTRISGHFMDDPEVLGLVAECWTKRGEWQRADRVYQRILTLDPSNLESLSGRRRCWRNLGLPDEPSLLAFVAGLNSAQRQKIREVARGLGKYPPKEVDDINDLMEALVQAGKWPEVIELLGAEEPEKLIFDAGLCLAIAHWGLTGAVPVRLCELALQQARDTNHNTHYCEMEVWLFWAVGKISEAMRRLEETAQSLEEDGGDLGYGFSPWRFRFVPLELLRDDLALVRRFLQGESLCPAFLRPPLAESEKR